MHLTYCTTHLEDAPGILHYQSGSEAYGRLDLIDKSPLSPRARAHVTAAEQRSYVQRGVAGRRLQVQSSAAEHYALRPILGASSQACAKRGFDGRTA